MNQRRKVTQAEFDQIECNRCGQCCEPLWLPSPLQMVEAAWEPLPSKATAERIQERARFIAWLDVLQPSGNVEPDAEPGASHEYHCARLQRDAQGLTYCSAYEDRPSVCRDFPYGRPADPQQYPDCAWNVEIFELKVGGTYPAIDGSQVSVLWRAGPSLYVRYEDGREAALDAEAETRRIRDIIVEREFTDEGTS